MRILLTILCAVAIAQKEKGGGKKKGGGRRGKKNAVCYGVEDENADDCSQLDKEACAGDARCAVGEDRVEKKYKATYDCFDKKSKMSGDFCDSDDECICGSKCLMSTLFNKKMCTICRDYGTEKDECNADDRCFYMPKKQVCAQKKDECNERPRGQCTDDEFCRVNKDTKMCERAYTPECIGKIQDNHHLCYEKTTKEECMAVVKATPFGSKQMCKMGYNKYEKEDTIKKCMTQNKIGMGKTCTTEADCGCGLTCFEFDFGFGTPQSSCSLCRDLTDSVFCEQGIAKGMPCKWVGEVGVGGTGLCLRIDICADKTYDESGCKAIKTCGYDADSGACARKKMNKRDCAALNEDDGVMCKKQPECKWKPGKTKKGKTKKGKCSFQKIKGGK